MSELSKWWKVLEPYKRVFVAYFHFVGWWAFSLGISLDVKSPNIEIHLPFGFLRIGWSEGSQQRPINWKECQKTNPSFGLKESRLWEKQ